jgi:hypothetical protein
MVFGSIEHKEFLALAGDVSGRINSWFQTEFKKDSHGAWERMEAANDVVGLDTQIQAFLQLCGNADISGIKGREEQYQKTGKALAVRLQELAGSLEIKPSGLRVLEAFMVSSRL